jgi:prepilin-type processing-associated H-X9-DG protein
MLCVVLEIHKNDYNGNISNPAKWCDILHQECDIDLDDFRCNYEPFGPSSYAMNENIPADTNELPGDLVLLFESAPGWNQIGGPDDVVTDRHGRPGANIAFADGHVEFVDADDIPTLRWTIEQ